MARPLRIEFDGAVYHFTSCGNARKHIYKDDEDRSTILEVLREVNSRFNWLCHAYCLMNNHYHLVIETPDGNLSQGMRHLNGVYTQRFNRKHNRVGHIFQGRYKAIVLDRDSYLLEVCRYVVLNPVRARAAEKPEEWAWSSYKSTAGLEQPHKCLTIDWVLGQFGVRRGQAESRYRDFVREGMGQKGIWDKVRGQSALGEEDFAERMAGLAKGREDMREIPKRQRYVGRPPLARLLADRADARAVQQAVKEYGYSLKEVGEYLGIHYSTVSRRVTTAANARNKT